MDEARPEQTLVTSSVIDLKPFQVCAPYFAKILAYIKANAPALLDSPSVIEALMALYCVNPRAFMDANRILPSATDGHIINTCLDLARELTYSSMCQTGQKTTVWPSIKTAFCEILELICYHQPWVDKCLFGKKPNQQGVIFARAVTFMVLALRQAR